MKKLYQPIKDLLNYGLTTGMIDRHEVVYSRNLLLDLFREPDWEEPEDTIFNHLEDVREDIQEGFILEMILKQLLDEAAERGLLGENTLTERDLFDSKIMNCITARPADVIQAFKHFYKDDPQTATDWYYDFSKNTDYIRRYRISKDLRWGVDSKYGDMEISINLSKPEKDPKAIAAARESKDHAYPACQLCLDNVGYAGRLDHPGRANHRVIPVDLCGELWYLQYSPYVYYNEHCIVFSEEHRPMKISRDTFDRLTDFASKFPHYFIGSNADLPIVGGSILSHDHFQGGCHEFPMDRAEVEGTFRVQGYSDVSCAILHWPLSVIRLQSYNQMALVALAEHILEQWRGYTDEEAMIFAETNGEPHNTITPIARMRGDVCELNLVLRNNLTTEEHPLGLFHPHEELHHIKKENIGLIEVMGLAILPSRLKKEIEDLSNCLVYGKDVRVVESLSKHADWVDGLLKKYPKIDETNVNGILCDEIGDVFVKVLEDAGVFKCTEQGRDYFARFIETL